MSENNFWNPEHYARTREDCYYNFYNGEILINPVCETVSSYVEYPINNINYNPVIPIVSSVESRLLTEQYSYPVNIVPYSNTILDNSNLYISTYANPHLNNPYPHSSFFTPVEGTLDYNAIEQDALNYSFTENELLNINALADMISDINIVEDNKNNASNSYSQPGQDVMLIDLNSIESSTNDQTTNTHSIWLNNIQDLSLNSHSNTAISNISTMIDPILQSNFVDAQPEISSTLSNRLETEIEAANVFVYPHRDFVDIEEHRKTVSIYRTAEERTKIENEQRKALQNPEILRAYNDVIRTGKRIIYIADLSMLQREDLIYPVSLLLLLNHTNNMFTFITTSGIPIRPTLKEKAEGRDFFSKWDNRLKISAIRRLYLYTISNLKIQNENWELQGFQQLKVSPSILQWAARDLYRIIPDSYKTISRSAESNSNDYTILFYLKAVEAIFNLMNQRSKTTVADILEVWDGTSIYRVKGNIVQSILTRPRECNKEVEEYLILNRILTKIENELQNICNEKSTAMFCRIYPIIQKCFLDSCEIDSRVYSRAPRYGSIVNIAEHSYNRYSNLLASRQNISHLLNIRINRLIPPLYFNSTTMIGRLYSNNIEDLYVLTQSKFYNMREICERRLDSSFARTNLIWLSNRRFYIGSAMARITDFYVRAVHAKSCQEYDSDEQDEIVDDYRSSTLGQRRTKDLVLTKNQSREFREYKTSDHILLHKDLDLKP